MSGYKRPRPLNQLSLRQLKNRKKKLEAEIADVQPRYAQRLARLSEENLARLREQIRQCDVSIASERAKFPTSLGSLLFGRSGPSALSDERVSQLKRKRSELKSELYSLEHPSQFEWTLSRQTGKWLAEAKHSVAALEREIDARHKKEDRIRSLKNKAASSTKAKRALAGSLKAKLHAGEQCPYCFGPLGNGAHADHIYPVSKGGESTQRNMVMVCDACNLKKRDKTLRNFIKDEGLDRDAIEARLDELGKDY